MFKRSVTAGALLLTAVAVAGSSSAVASGAGVGKKPGEEAHLVPIEKITVPIIGSTRIEGSLRVELVLDATNAGAAETISDQAPAIRATLIAAALEFARLYASAHGASNAERLRAGLTSALKREHEGVRDVLVVEIVTRSA